VNQIAGKIMELIENEGLRKTMGDKGRERFHRLFTLNHFIENMDKTFQAVLAAN